MWLKTVLHQNNLVILPIKRKWSPKLQNELTHHHERTTHYLLQKVATE